MNMDNKGALSGIRVLDLSRVLAGPYCTMMLADMGAEVIKIEMPDIGDDSRAFGPFLNGESGYYMNMNRNKKGVTLNLKGKGRELFLKMVEKADVVIENYRPDVMEKLGLGYEDLKKVNPRIIYGTVSGFGHTGPYSLLPGYDVIGQAMSGLMSTTGWPDGEPTRIGTAMADSLAGLTLTVGVLAALQYRHAAGIGQNVDIGLMDSGIANMQILHPIYLIDKRIPPRIGNRYESNYPTDSFRAKDGSFVIGAANDKLWQALCKVIGQPEIAFDERFLNNKKRVENHELIKPLIEAWTMTRTVAEAVGELSRVGVPAAPIYDIAQVVADPHVAAREMFVEVEHPKAGKTTLTGSPIKLSETKPAVRTPAPLLGQHNAEVYEELLGLTEAELKQLKEEKVI
ncbi:MAG TPA: CoA transferase [Anaerovoracaceae bacterium]|nr:CoA transferase [Anaerovoracaceae bacterium]